MDDNKFSLERMSELSAVMREKLFAVWLSMAMKPGNSFAKTLIEEKGSFEAVYELSESDYTAYGIKPKSREMAGLCNKDLSESMRVLGFCDHYSFGILIYTNEYYPRRLKSIENPPVVLYVRGRWVDFDSNVCIAVVGTRSYSEAGWKSTYMIADGLARGGAVVVTGLASGIDTAAASASLAASGMTVGVLGTGVERVYPSENKPLFDEMYKHGTVISELAPFSETSPSYFPVRNRIISGLCQGVLVGEGAQNSGAMITAEHAANQGRLIFAIPGDISSPESSGVNGLISSGATPVFDAWGILEKYAYVYPDKITNPGLPITESVPEGRSKKRIRVEKGKKPAKSSADHKADDKSDGKSAKRLESVPDEGGRQELRPVEANFKMPRSATAQKSPKASQPTKNKTENNETLRDTGTAIAPKVIELDDGTQLELTASEISVFEAIPENGVMKIDELSEKTGYRIDEVLEFITVLEVFGYVSSDARGVKRSSATF